MTSSDLHAAVFAWPHTDAQSVVLTGSFDAWTASCHLTKTSTGFSGTAHVPWGEKTTYKFIVDGTWTIANDQPTETDASGNVNNVYVAPPHPSVAKTINGTAATVAEPIVTSTTAPIKATNEGAAPSQAGALATLAPAAVTAKGAAVTMVEAIAPRTTEQAPQSPVPVPEPTLVQPSPLPANETPTSAPVQEPTSAPQLDLDAPESLLSAAETSNPHLAPEVPVHVLRLEPPALGVTTATGEPQEAAEAVEPSGEYSDDVEPPSTHSPNGHAGVDGTAEEERSRTPEEGADVRAAVMNGATAPTLAALDAQPSGDAAHTEGDTGAVIAPTGEGEAGDASTRTLYAPTSGEATSTAPSAMVSGAGTETPTPGTPMPAPSATTNGNAAPTTPSKEKEKTKGVTSPRMRFPSLSASARSISRRSVASDTTQTSATNTTANTSEFGAGAGAEAGTGTAKDSIPENAEGAAQEKPESPAVRAVNEGSGAHRKKHMSFFGRLKEIFESR